VTEMDSRSSGATTLPRLTMKVTDPDDVCIISIINVFVSLGDTLVSFCQVINQPGFFQSPLRYTSVSLALYDEALMTYV